MEVLGFQVSHGRSTPVQDANGAQISSFGFRFSDFGVELLGFRRPARRIGLLWAVQHFYHVKFLWFRVLYRPGTKRESD